jgi:hypothetical protein
MTWYTLYPWQLKLTVVFAFCVAHHMTYTLHMIHKEPYSLEYYVMCA